MLLNHYLYFRHFSAPPTPSRSYSRYDDASEIPTFTEIASCFGICVWLVPFALFVSLSAGEMVLPSMGSEWATGGDTVGGGGVGGGYGGEGRGGGGGGGGFGGGGFGGEGRGRRAKGLVKAVIEGAGGWVAGVVDGVGWGRGEYGGRRVRRAL